jgi:hypothetical protein
VDGGQGTIKKDDPDFDAEDAQAIFDRVKGGVLRIIFHGHAGKTCDPE